MCGIIGIFQREPGKPQINQFHLDKIAHRGPDGRGIYQDEYVALGHTRLSIIDLTESGHQPMHYSDGRYTITYNGEIYNYLELREELKALGGLFLTNSDTEVVLVAYHIWGNECVTHFRGMFAFTIWDKKKKIMFLARDRCGEKPLIYWQDNKTFIFASEFKGILPLLPEKPELEPCIIDMYLHYQYVPEPYTLLKGVHKLPAGHYILLRPSDEEWIGCPIQYWSPDEIQSNSDLPVDEEKIAISIREKLEESIILTLRSDVPVGVALSGGIDSGAIAALAQKHYSQPLHAFSVGYPGKPSYDERDQAKKLADDLGMIFHEVEIPVDQFVDFFPEFVRIMDEPNADIAAFGHYSIPKVASDLNIKVILTGIGGDELFWGYQWTVDAIKTNLKRKPQFTISSSINQKVKSYLNLLFRNDEAYYDIVKEYLNPKNHFFFFPKNADFWQLFNIKKQLYGKKMENLSKDNPFIPIDIGVKGERDIPMSVQRLLFDTWLVSNCLSISDRVSMSVGVETRLPFLDYKLIELVNAIRVNKPDHDMGHKYRLREALKGVLPSEVLVRQKRGFQPPVQEWMKQVISRYGIYLCHGKLCDEGYISKTGIENILSNANNQINNLFFVYKLIILEMWYREVIS